MLCTRWPLPLALSLACAEPQPPAPVNEPASIQVDAPASEQGASTRDASTQDASAPPSELDTSVSAPDAHAVAQPDAAAPPVEPDASAADAQPPIASARTPLVVPERWQLLDASVDPFDDRPAMIDCSSAGVVPEMLSDERVLGVETGWCNYLTAQQPTQRAVQPGEVIKVRLWHFALSAPEPAEAHAAVHIADLRVLDERIAIPGPGGLIVKQLTAEQAIPAGTPVHFHLHNHGENSWALVEVSAGPAAAR